MPGTSNSLFKDFTSRIEKAGIESIELKKIAVRKSSGELCFLFYCPELPRPAEFLRIEGIAGELAGNFPRNLVYEYAAKPALHEDPEALFTFIREYAAVSKPFLAPVLECCRLQAKPSEITLHFPDEHSIDMLRFSKFDAVLSEFLNQTLKIETRVKFNLDKSMEAVYPVAFGGEKGDNAGVTGVTGVPAEKTAAMPEKKPAPAAQAKPEPKPQEPKPPEQKTEKKEEKKPLGDLVTGKKIMGETIAISGIDDATGDCIIEGTLLSSEDRDTKDGKRKIINFAITDGTSTIQCKMFCNNLERGAEIVSVLEKGKAYKVRGTAKYDTYAREVCVTVKDINKTQVKKRMDESGEKRVELHLHTVMSAQDSTVGIKDIIRRAIDWGHEAIAITDHGVVQAFPDAEGAAKGAIKIIYGMEAYLVDDTAKVYSGEKKHGFDAEYVVFDIETTGLQPASEGITEIGAVKIAGGEVVDTFSTFVQPGKHIPLNITRLTGITDDMVKDAPGTKEALTAFAAFAGDACLVAHNASFDTGFVFRKGRENGVPFKNDVVDTLTLCRKVIPKLTSYSLNVIADHLCIPLHHHRALNDAECTGKIFLECLARLREKGIDDLSRIDEYGANNINTRDTEVFHAVLLCKNRTGLKNLYKLVSESHLKHFYRRPRIPKSLLKQHREGLILGTACEQGELFRAVLHHADEKTIAGIAREYDYFELQPKGNNAFLLRNGVLKNDKELEEIYFKIMELGRKFEKPVVATCDVHFLEPADEYFRRILMGIQKFEDADNQAPLYFRTTEEMLKEFAFLGAEDAYKIVVENTRKIAEEVEVIKLLPKEPAMPKIEGADEEIRRMAEERAREIYGDPLPEIVEKRLEKELHNIISHGFAVLYFIAHKLVKKSLDDGYLVGSRGSVGSSFVAFTTGITEVNPLKPHYVCPSCKFSDFDTEKYPGECGIDLPERDCPNCGTRLKRDGYNIHFEVFLGINADKVPDIDLNFSGEYQPMAHKFTEELFGSEHVFRAGTISSIAEKTAYGFAKAYLEERGIMATKAEILRLAEGITGVKRTTGQHPGGLVVVPQDRDIHDFTPVQRPANDTESDTVTTHFDFNSLHDTLVKLDILGHDDPTALRMLHDLTGLDPKKIPLDDKATMSLFSSPEALDLKPEQILGCVTGTIGIPEFGTRFVRQMLSETTPSTMTELVRICGLSHGTDVWLNNAQELIEQKTATLSDVIGTRDDIMNYLIKQGVEQRQAFFTMESVRKGKGLKEDMEKAMVENSVPTWFIDSCKKISYLFPKAHAAAYVIMAFRVAYYKVHYPKEFYATYFTVRADNFSAQYVMDGIAGVKKHISAFEALGNTANAIQKSVLTILEVVLEMYERGIGFLPVDLEKSHATVFTIEGDNIRLPFVAVENLGGNAAQNIVKAREAASFISIEDLKQRARLSSATIDKLKNYGCLYNMTASNQINFFD